MRHLERQIGAVARKIAARAAAVPGGEEQAVTVRAADLPDYLGPPRFHQETGFRLSRPGVATGVAWTETGGDVLFVEATLLPSGHHNLILTGQLGSVMQESARAALSHIRASAAELGIPAETLDGHDLHVHVPAGAIPKDGPSAGVTMATAIVSALRKQLVRQGCRDDGRDHPERPRSARRRHPREGARGTPLRHQDVRAPGAERSQIWRSFLVKSGRDAVRAGGHSGGGAQGGAPAKAPVKLQISDCRLQIEFQIANGDF